MLDRRPVALEPTPTEAPASRLTRMRRWLAGPRYIDLPIRLLLCVVAVISGLPISRESSEPFYVVLDVCAALVIGMSAFAPIPAGLIATALFFVQSATYPELLALFQPPIILSAAVLLTYLRWRMALVLTALAFLTSATSQVMQITGANSFSSLAISCLLYFLLGLSAAGLEIRIQRETSARIAATRDHEHKLQRLRATLALNTHDSVSHGLATERAIMKLLAAERDEREAKRLLSQLALANSETQHQLRLLLKQFMGAESAHHSADDSLDHRLRAHAARLQESAALVGSKLSIRVGALPATGLAGDDELLLLVRELATNILRHSGDPAEGSIEIDFVPTSNAIMLRSRNRADEAPSELPRSLSRRAERRGGQCQMEYANGDYSVTISIPVNSANITHSSDAEGGTT